MKIGNSYNAPSVASDSKKILHSILFLLIEGKFRNFEHYKFFSEFLETYDYILPKERYILPELIRKIVERNESFIFTKSNLLRLCSIVDAIESTASIENQQEFLDFLRKQNDSSNE